MHARNMNYSNVLSIFNIDYDTYEELKKEDDPDVPVINDKDNDRKLIKWVSIFTDCLYQTYGSRGPLVYVIQEPIDVPSEVDDPLDANSYYEVSGIIHEELVPILSHNGPIYKHDNTSIYTKIEKVARGISIESNVKAFYPRKDGRGLFIDFISSHAGETKYCAIIKKRMNLLQNIKWNVWS